MSARRESNSRSRSGWRAIPGSRRVIIDRRNEAVEDVESIRAPQAGHDLALSIDARLQYLAFRELKAAVELNKAKAGGIVVLDAKTGEMLALANSPTYNPNNRGKARRRQLRNRVFTDTFEPGSTMKPFTVAAGAREGQVHTGHLIETAPGTLTIGSATIHDAHPHGALTVAQVIQKSSNVGAAKIALAPAAGDDVGDVRQRSASARRSRLGFPGEVGGRLRPAKTLAADRAGDDVLWSWHFGEPDAVGACLHGVRPRRRADAGRRCSRIDGCRRRQAGDSPQTARAVRHMLELAVQPGGTAPKAQVAGLPRRRQDRYRAQARRRQLRRTNMSPRSSASRRRPIRAWWWR